MPAPEGFMVTVNYKGYSYSYCSSLKDARAVLNELANKKDTMFDWLSCKITIKRVE